ncbi:hypothetical protein WR25_13369 isoform F [Diploscapter pachys]|uniref:Uncharacterized protein n=1 Tax=Diploscapter pachys TaxID=2018661 RepID=A0A2A2J2K8_9BILA|nr:hypothetical protein WR25_13369 isoform C [Diploscapter pachys]PAV55912.1 hypothetical protein WR25_13369 isoform D [Diploscapter pachys]PAV55913.1 hypothetical protein WR25_13369 isoform E [Diploscapter pachys]PAV55914.1 hypothetical protein WR25_13369 isoform F [Diploscapter pachys]
MSKESSSSRSNSKDRKEKDSKRSRDKSKEKSKSSKSSSSKEKKKTSGKDEVKKIKEVKPVPKQEEYAYEDDFEDYEEDFEDDIEEETPKVGQSIQSEVPQRKPRSDEIKKSNDPISEETPMLRRLASRQGGRPVEEEKKAKPKKAPVKMDRVLSASERTIDFSSPYTTDYEAMSDAEKKYRKLREMITLERVKFIILDQPPMKDYDYYMEMFGAVGKAQNSCQTGDDDLDEEVQTDEPTTETKWTMHPANDNFGWGTEGGGQQIGAAEAEEERNLQMFRENHLQKERLKQFMETAGQVRLFLSENEVCAVSYTHDANILYVGLKDGSVCAFDSHEPESNFEESLPWIDSPNDIPLRLPAFDSSYVSVMIHDGKVFPIVGIHAMKKERLPKSYQSPQNDTNFSSSGALYALDESGTVSRWSPMWDTEGILGGLSNLGFFLNLEILGTRPGARFSMQLSGVIRPHDVVLNSSSQHSSLMVNCLLVHEDSEQFLIGQLPQQKLS